MATTDLDLGRYQLGWSDAEDYVFKPKKGINESIVREMSEMKGEPTWMRDFRLRALTHFERKPMAPWFATQMPNLDFDDIYYYIKPTGGQVDKWEDLPDAIKNTYEKLGIPEAERKYLSGVTAQYESEVVFHRNRDDLEAQGVYFCDMDTAVRDYPELVRRWFGKLIPPNDNKFAALELRRMVRGVVHLRPARREGGHAAPGVLPHQRGEHGPVRADTDHRRRGLTGALHRGLLGARVLDRLPPLGRGRVGGAARRAHHLYHHPELVDQRLQPRDKAGPGRGRGARRVDRREHRLAPDHEVPLGLPDGTQGQRRGAVRRLRGAGQHQDAGAKMYHVAPETTSTIVSKSISKDGGKTTYRGKVHVDPEARGSKSFVRCDALLLDDESISETKPYMEVGERDARIGHEATVSKVGDDQLFYLMSRGLSEGQAMSMIVNGFIEPVTRTLPMEYAVEWSRLIELQMEGSVG